MEQILKYFPNLSVEQQQQFAALDALYRDWNAKINVISRKDIDNLYEHHVLHSLAIAKMLPFKASAQAAVSQAFHSPFCFLSATSSSSTVRARKFAWRRRCAMPSD